MTESKQTRIRTKRKAKLEDEETAASAPAASSEERSKQLQELDEFMEGVLQKAGEEFLDEFKQVEGE